MTISNIVKNKLLNSDQYTAVRATTMASGETINLVIENPPDSSKTIVADTQEVTTDSPSHGTFFRSPDIANGTEVSASNDFLGSSETTSATIWHDADLTNATSETPFPLSETGGGEAGLAKRPQIAISPDESIAIQVTADSNDCDVLIIIVYWETERGVQN